MKGKVYGESCRMFALETAGNEGTGTKKDMEERWKNNDLGGDSWMKDKT